MPGPGLGLGVGAPDGSTGPVGPEEVAWRTRLEEMKRNRSKQFLRINRKMLNHLCSIGLIEADLQNFIETLSLPMTTQ